MNHSKNGWLGTFSFEKTVEFSDSSNFYFWFLIPLVVPCSVEKDNERVEMWMEYVGCSAALKAMFLVSMGINVVGKCLKIFL